MKKHFNLTLILAIFIIPVVMYYSFRSTDTDTISIAKGIKPTVIDFSSEMCLECKELKKVLDQVEPKYCTKIIFKKILVNSANKEEKVLIKKYGVNVVPTLVYLDKNGNLVKKTEGSLTKEELERNLNRIVNGKSG
jgi:thioredoxin-like negative regulator of GroEL